MAWLLLDCHLTFWFRITYLSVVCCFFSKGLPNHNKQTFMMAWASSSLDNDFWFLIFWFFFFTMRLHGNSTKGRMSSCPCSQWRQQCHSSRWEQPALLKEESESTPVRKHGMTFFFSSSVIFTTKVSVVLFLLERLGLGNAAYLQFR